MITYLSAFIFYTLAMIGILLIGFVIYKKIMPVNRGDNKGMIKILDSLPIGNKKVLLVVKIKNEKFLIASGLEHTTFLSKLTDENVSGKNRNSQQIQQKTKSQTTADLWQNIQQGTNNVEVRNLDEMQNLINAQSNINETIPKMQRLQNEQSQTDEQYDELHQARLQKLQRQFSELYNKEEIPPKVTSQINKTDKQKLIKQLLKELNTDAQYSTKTEGKY